MLANLLAMGLPLLADDSPSICIDIHGCTSVVPEFGTSATSPSI
jgi:hypothetical protein